MTCYRYRRHRCCSWRRRSLREKQQYFTLYQSCSSCLNKEVSVKSALYCHDLDPTLTFMVTVSKSSNTAEHLHSFTGTLALHYESETASICRRKIQRIMYRFLNQISANFVPKGIRIILIYIEKQQLIKTEKQETRAI